jgi:TRAP-type mannitol/chloroaromatic compound transport system permease small subunit
VTALDTAIRLRRALDAAGHAMNVAAGWVFVACAFFVTFDVVARNTLGVSSQSTTELTGYMLAFGIAWGLPNALTARAHVRIDIFLNNVPIRARQYLHLLALLLLAVFVGFMAYGAIMLVVESWDFGATDMSLLRTPLIVPQGLWAFGLSAFFVLVLAMLAEALLLLAAGDSTAVDRLLGTRSYTEEAQEALDAVASVRRDGT